MFLRVALLFAVIAVAVRAETSFATAMALLHAKRYPEAREVLQKVVADEPNNAEAWYQLGMVWQARHDAAAYQEAVKCLAKAVSLAPENETYLGNFGGTSLELAEVNRSMSAALTGREAMEKALTINPDDLDVREGLFQYYLRAPFFVGGSEAKAAAQLEEIRRRDPSRATALAILARANDKDYAGAFTLCELELRKHPDNYTALYQYGRTASVSGQNLDRGLALLQKALTIDPPTRVSPTHSHVWCRIGVIQEKLGHRTEARAAYEAALKIDPSNRQAAGALENLK